MWDSVFSFIKWTARQTGRQTDITIFRIVIQRRLKDTVHYHHHSGQSERPIEHIQMMIDEDDGLLCRDIWVRRIIVFSCSQRGEIGRQSTKKPMTKKINKQNLATSLLQVIGPTHSFIRHADSICRTSSSPYLIKCRELYGLYRIQIETHRETRPEAP